jgi:hypothetical protein
MAAAYPRDAASGVEAQALCGKWYGSRSAERAGELGEDRQVGVELHAVQSTNAKRGERPVVLQAPELALDG